MKSLWIAFSVATLISTGCGQNADKSAENTKVNQLTEQQQVQTKTPKYKCPECGYGSDTTGDCPKDKISLVKVGWYYCPECYMCYPAAGKCKMCGVELKKME